MLRIKPELYPLGSTSGACVAINILFASLDVSYIPVKPLFFKRSVLLIDATACVLRCVGLAFPEVGYVKDRFKGNITSHLERNWIEIGGNYRPVQALERICT